MTTNATDARTDRADPHAPSPDVRGTEVGLEIHAPPEAVWRALTDPEELVRWFSLQAGVEPGPGGLVEWRWGDAYYWPTRIEAWEPTRRLCLSYVQDAPEESTRATPLAPEREERRVLVMDFHLEGDGGTTRLRLVHSGFGRDASWDDEYEGVRRGWLDELRALKHYVERHAGRDRRVWWVSVARALRPADAWERLRALVREDADGTLRVAVPGAEATLVPARMDGAGALVARVPAWDDALLRLTLDGGITRPVTCTLHLSSWEPAIPRERTDALLAAFRGSLDVSPDEVLLLER